MPIILLSLLGGIIGRWHGGGFEKTLPNFSKTYRNIAWATPIGVLAVFEWIDYLSSVSH